MRTSKVGRARSTDVFSQFSRSSVNAGMPFPLRMISHFISNGVPLVSTSFTRGDSEAY